MLPTPLYPSLIDFDIIWLYLYSNFFKIAEPNLTIQFFILPISPLLYHLLFF